MSPAYDDAPLISWLQPLIDVRAAQFDSAKLLDGLMLPECADWSVCLLASCQYRNTNEVDAAVSANVA
jgi:hypothetical protein